jgi:hypothetical protein
LVAGFSFLLCASMPEWVKAQLRILRRENDAVPAV